MRRFAFLIFGICLIASTAAARAAPVLMISIDGLRPADVSEAERRGLRVPTLRALERDGAWSRGVRGVLPTLTYPSHTTLLTGVSPARHGIANNLTFDPLGKNQTGWYWYAQHLAGPDTAAAHAVLERIDAAVGALVASARRGRPDVVIVVVSDHGFAAVTHDVNLSAAFADAGLIKLDPATHKVVSWEAEPWFAGVAAGVVLARTDDLALRTRVEALLTRLASDPSLGIARWIGAQAIARLGGAGDAQYFVDFRIGWEMGRDPSAPLVGPAATLGMHGYFPDAPEMRSTFIIEGPGLPRRGDLGEVDMRDIAPTVAKLLGVGLPTAEGRPLF